MNKLRKRGTYQRGASQTRQRKHAQNKIDRIMSTSVKMFAQKGYAQSTVREIASAADINSGVLYNYIINKEDILLKIFEIFHDQRQASLVEEGIYDIQNPEEQLRTALRKSMEYFSVSKDEALIVYRELSSLSKSDAKNFIDKERDFINVFEEIIQRGVDHNVFDVKNPHYMANMIVYQLSIFHLRCRYMKEEFTSEEIMDLTEDYILSALLKRKSQ